MSRLSTAMPYGCGRLFPALISPLVIRSNLECYRFGTPTFEGWSRWSFSTLLQRHSGDETLTCSTSTRPGWPSSGQIRRR